MGMHGNMRGRGRYLFVLLCILRVIAAGMARYRYLYYEPMNRLYL